MPSHIKLIKTLPSISLLKDTQETKSKSPPKDCGWGLLRTERVLETRIDYFCNETIKKGDPLEVDPNNPMLARKSRGGFVGLSMNDVVNVDLTRGCMINTRDVVVGGKITILTRGTVVIDKPLKTGSLYVGKKGFTSEETDNRVGVVLSSDGETSKVEIGS